METIVLDEADDPVVVDPNIIDLDKHINDDVIEILEIDDEEDFSKEKLIDEVFRENKAVGEFVDKCLQLDSSGGMQRVITNVFMPLFRSCSVEFKRSWVFDRALTKVMLRLERRPKYKYTHVKEFCDLIKINKKKVHLTTISSQVRPRDVPDYDIPRKKKKRSPISNQKNINLVNEFEVPVINLDEHFGCASLSSIDANQCTVSNINNNCKTNHDRNKSVNVIGNTPSPVPYRSSTTAHYIDEDDVFRASSKTQPSQNTSIEKQILKIENEIAVLKKNLDQLQLFEVTNDTMDSPYLQCDLYQNKIVRLYKKLCELTKQQPVKRREVRLHTTNGASQLAIKKLELFINSNIEEDGLPHFPDFRDVVMCVREANNEGNLRWDNTRVMSEARSLFEYCGRALQRNRQRREWRDMLELVKWELGDDPADLDPVLLAKLESNRRIAEAKVCDVLERYTLIETRAEEQLKDLEDDSGSDNESYVIDSNDQSQLTITHVYSMNVKSGLSTDENKIPTTLENSSSESTQVTLADSSNTDINAFRVSPDCSQSLLSGAQAIPTVNNTENTAMQCYDVSSSSTDNIEQCVIKSNNVTNLNDDAVTSSFTRDKKDCVIEKRVHIESDLINKKDSILNDKYKADISKNNNDTIDYIIEEGIRMESNAFNDFQSDKDSDVDILVENARQPINETYNSVDCLIEENIKIQKLQNTIQSKINVFNSDISALSTQDDTFNQIRRISDQFTFENSQRNIIKNNATECNVSNTSNNVQNLHKLADRGKDGNNDICSTNILNSLENKTLDQCNDLILTSDFDDSQTEIVVLGINNEDEDNISTNNNNCSKNVTNTDEAGTQEINKEMNTKTPEENKTQADSFNLSKVKVEENERVIRELQELGDNFTTTIVDLLDPYVIIEISSDSSSDDDSDDDEERIAEYDGLVKDKNVT